MIYYAEWLTSCYVMLAICAHFAALTTINVLIYHVTGERHEYHQVAARRSQISKGIRLLCRSNALTLKGQHRIREYSGAGPSPHPGL